MDIDSKWDVWNVNDASWPRRVIRRYGAQWAAGEYVEEYDSIHGETDALDYETIAVVPHGTTDWDAEIYHVRREQVTAYMADRIEDAEIADRQ